MCSPAIIAPVLGAAIGGGASIIAANKQKAAMQKAQQAAEERAAKNAQAAEQQSNKMNQRDPNLAALFGSVKSAASKGLGSTFTTGAGGVPLSALPLGGGSLLGS